METLEVEAGFMDDFGRNNDEDDVHNNRSLQLGESGVTALPLNPLELPNIVMEVQRGLCLQDLMNVRLVSKTWEYEANRFISQIPITLTFQSFVRIPYFRFNEDDHRVTGTSIDQPKTLASLTSAAVSSPSLVKMFKTFELVDCYPNNLEDWSSFLATFGPHLQSLTIRRTKYRADSGSYYFFCDMFSGMKNLSILKLDVGLWRHIKWSETEGRQLKLPSLKHLELVCVRYDQFNDHTTYEKNLWLGCPDWMAVNFWSTLRNILHSAPNLKLLRTLDCNYLPGPVMADIFKNAPFQLKTLILGEFGTVERMTFDGEVEFIKQGNNFFPLLTGNPCAAYLKSINLPRPDKATAENWDKLFAWLAKRLERLHLIRVCLREIPDGIYDPPSRKLPLCRIQFKIPMPALRYLWIPLSTLGAATKPSVLPIFPNLKKVVISITMEEDVQYFRQIGEQEQTQVFNNFSFISRLALKFWADTAGAEDVMGTRALFEALANSNRLQNLQQLDLYDNMTSEEIEVFFDVYAQSSIAAQRIKILRFKELSWTCGLKFKIPKPFTGVDGRDPNKNSHSLECFRNLKHFYLGFDVCLEHGGRPRLNRQFLENFVLDLPKLDSFKLMDAEIPEDVVPGLEQKFPGFRENSMFYTYAHNSSSEGKDDFNAEAGGQSVGVVGCVRKFVRMRQMGRPRLFYILFSGLGAFLILAAMLLYFFCF